MIHLFNCYSVLSQSFYHLRIDKYVSEKPKIISTDVSFATKNGLILLNTAFSIFFFLYFKFPLFIERTLLWFIVLLGFFSCFQQTIMKEYRSPLCVLFSCLHSQTSRTIIQITHIFRNFGKSSSKWKR